MEGMSEGLPLRNQETTSPPAAMTSQNYLQLLHEKSDSFPSNLASYANTSTIHSDQIHPGISSSSHKTVPYLNKEETFQDLPTLPQKMMIRSKTENGIHDNPINNGIPLLRNNHFETSSEPQMNSENLDVKSSSNNLCSGVQPMDSRRSS